MWPVYFVISYFLLALLIPTAWALGGAWRRARAPRNVTCPGCGTNEIVTLDRWYAVRRHAAGEFTELRVAACTKWPERKTCHQECLS
jgi:hypothetical protein